MKKSAGGAAAESLVDYSKVTKKDLLIKRVLEL